MPKLTYANFSNGIQGSQSLTPNLRNASMSDIRNMYIDNDGQLVARAGRTDLSAYTTGNAIVRVMPVIYSDGNTRISHLFIQEQAATGIGLKYYKTGTNTFEPVTADATLTTFVNTKFGRRFSSAVAGNRLFLSNGTLQLFVTLDEDPNSTAPTMYYWGFTPNATDGYEPDRTDTAGGTPMALTLAATLGGSLEASKYYGYTYTYYDPTYGMESRGCKAADPSDAILGFTTTIQTTASNKQVLLSDIADTDRPLATQVRVYRTKAQDTEDDAKVAQLYWVTTINGVGSNPCTFANHTDGQGDGALTQFYSSSDHDNPAASMDRITLYAGRLWGSLKGSSTMVYTKIDGNGAPVFDAFPDTNAAVPQRIFVDKGDGDHITGLEPSANGQQLQIFKEKSVHILRGTGLITGINTLVAPAGATYSDLDLSFKNTSAGCIAPLTLATAGDLTFFLAADRQVWVSSGGTLSPVSGPIQDILDTIPEYVFDSVYATGSNSDLNAPVTAWVYQNAYHIAFPVAAITSGLTESRVIARYDLLKKYWTLFELKDQAGGDADEIGIQDAFHQPTGSGALSADTLYIAVREASEASTSVWKIQKFLGSESNNTLFDRSFTTNEVQLPSESIVNGVFVYPTTSATATTVSMATDYGSLSSAGSYTPTKSNRYRLNTFKRGRLFKVKVNSTTLDNIERFEIDYQPRS